MAGPKKRLTLNERNLIRRYLVWCYKTTKESMDRVERKFTQLRVDRFVLAQLPSQKSKGYNLNEGYDKLLQGFKKYIAKKEDDALREKFAGNSSRKLKPNYQYLIYRFEAIQQAIVYFLGKNELKKIEGLYEQEMTQRILEAKEHA